LQDAERPAEDGICEHRDLLDGRHLRGWRRFLAALHLLIESLWEDFLLDGDVFIEPLCELLQGLSQREMWRPSQRLVQAFLDGMVIKLDGLTFFGEECARSPACQLVAEIKKVLQVFRSTTNSMEVLAKCMILAGGARDSEAILEQPEGDRHSNPGRLQNI
jgi:hypothetical protein